MALLHVRAHWTDTPSPGVPQLSPAPGWAVAGGAAGYPNAPATMSFGPAAGGGLPVPPDWPSPPTGPVKQAQLYHVWVPLVRQTDLDSSGWAAGVSWGGSPPPPWPTVSGVPVNTLDEGYGPAASGFQVVRLRLFQESMPGSDFSYSVYAPSGAFVGTVTPASPGWSTWLTAAVPDGKGFWHIVIDRAAGSSVASPGLLGAPGGNAVDEPYVSPYGNRFEGVLGVEFDGQEIVVTPPTTVTGSVVAGACDERGQRGPTDLVLTFTPPLPPGSTYTVVWTTGVAPAATQTGTVVGGPLATLSRSVLYPPGTYYPSATVIFTVPGGGSSTTTVSFATGPAAGTVVVEPCPGPCHDVAVSTVPADPCVRAGQTVVTTTTATFSPSTPAWTGPVEWQVRGPAGLLPLPTPVPTGPVLTYAFAQPGHYEVTATIERSASCSPRRVSDTSQLDVVRCDCPSFTGVLKATSPDGCTFSFSAQVSNPTAAALTFVWDFGSGPDPTAPNSPATTHTYPPGTTGPRTVQLTVSSPGCSDTITVPITVSCGGGGGGCPQLSGALTATAAAGACAFTFTAAVANPAGAATSFAWSFGDGSTATTTVPTAGHTYAGGGPFTATVTMTSPGCAPGTASATVSCPTTPPGGGGGGGGGGCFCVLLLVLALILLTLASAAWLTWGCGGFVNALVLATAVTLSLLGLFLLLLWAFLCAPGMCAALVLLLNVLAALAVVMAVLALVLLLFGSVGCAVGALAVGALLGLAALGLLGAGKSIGCIP